MILGDNKQKRGYAFRLTTLLKGYYNETSFSLGYKELDALAMHTGIYQEEVDAQEVVFIANGCESNKHPHSSYPLVIRYYLSISILRVAVNVPAFKV